VATNGQKAWKATDPTLVAQSRVPYRFRDIRIALLISWRLSPDEQIIVEALDVAARTSFSGVFERAFTQSLARPLAPHGQRVSWEVMNMFRCNPTRD
jgi:hypothetical protein